MKMSDNTDARFKGEVSDTSPEISSGLATPSVASVEKGREPENNNFSDTRDATNAEDSDDSWSVIYSSDDALSVDDTESKLTASSNEEDGHNHAQNDKDDSDDVNRSITTIQNVRRNRDNGTGSISTLKEDLSEQWNESLSIPKLSMGEKTVAEPQLQATVTEDALESNLATHKKELEEAMKRFKNSAVVFAEYVGSRFHQFSEYVLNEKRDFKAYESISFPHQVTGKHVIAAVCLLGFAIYKFSSYSVESFSALTSGEKQRLYFDTNTPVTSYLMCQDSRSLAIVEISPNDLQLENIHLYGDFNRSAMQDIHSEVLYAKRHLLSCSSKAEPRRVVRKLMTSLCGSDVGKIKKITQEGAAGSIVYAYKNKGGPKNRAAKRIIAHYPDVLYLDVKNYVGNQEAVIIRDPVAYLRSLSRSAFEVLKTAYKDFQEDCKTMSAAQDVWFAKQKDHVVSSLNRFKETLINFKEESKPFAHSASHKAVVYISGSAKLAGATKVQAKKFLVFNQKLAREAGKLAEQALIKGKLNSKNYWKSFSLFMDKEGKPFLKKNQIALLKSARRTGAKLVSFSRYAGHHTKKLSIKASFSAKVLSVKAYRQSIAWSKVLRAKSKPVAVQWAELLKESASNAHRLYEDVQQRLCDLLN